MHHGHMHRGYVHHGYIHHCPGFMDTTIRITDTCIMDTSEWVTQPERPKGVKDEVKQAQRAQSQPKGPPARAPKLLVHDIFVGKCTFLWKSFVWRKIGSKMLNVEKNYEYHMCVLETFDLKINLCFYLRFDLFKVWSNKAFQKKRFLKARTLAERLKSIALVCSCTITWLWKRVWKQEITK